MIESERFLRKRGVWPLPFPFGLWTLDSGLWTHNSANPTQASTINGNNPNAYFDRLGFRYPPKGHKKSRSPASAREEVSYDESTDSCTCQQP